jgi:hypothetical protein
MASGQCFVTTSFCYHGIRNGNGGVAVGFLFEPAGNVGRMSYILLNKDRKFPQFLTCPNFP